MYHRGMQVTHYVSKYSQKGSSSLPLPWCRHCHQLEPSLQLCLRASRPFGQFLHSSCRASQAFRSRLSDFLNEQPFATASVDDVRYLATVLKEWYKFMSDRNTENCNKHSALGAGLSAASVILHPLLYWCCGAPQSFAKVKPGPGCGHPEQTKWLQGWVASALHPPPPPNIQHDTAHAI